MKHVISSRDFDIETLNRFLKTTKEFERNDGPFFLKPKILATLFFEPSTRTRLSFESAMIRLGGHCIGVADGQSSSTQKGESIYDTIRTVEGYADIIVIRHPIDGTARLASEAIKLNTPIINAGDGSNQHITQTLTDLYSIHKHFGKIDGIKIGYIGDLKYGRTVHSLIHALSMFDDVEHFFMPADSTLDIEEDHIRSIRHQKSHSIKTLEEMMEKLDVLYVTRLQKERYPDPMEFNRVAAKYRITPQSIEKRKEKMIILHPLPRNDEIDKTVDDMSCAKYFDQAHNGVIVRKTLLYHLIEIGEI